MKHLDKFLLVVYGINLVACILLADIPAVCGWACAFGTQLTVIQNITNN